MNEFEKEIIARLSSIEDRISALELPNIRLGPNREQEKELDRDRESVVKQLIDAAKREVPPVDRSKRCMLSGDPETPEHREIDPATGMQKDYVVLCPQERAKGFVAPVRRSYKHLKCGSVTTMGQALAETYARVPYFYCGNDVRELSRSLSFGSIQLGRWRTDGPSDAKRQVAHLRGARTQHGKGKRWWN